MTLRKHILFVDEEPAVQRNVAKILSIGAPDLRLTYASDGAEALRQRLGQLKSEGVAHVVVDAVANDDLFVIAEACSDMVLLTGGSAVAMPLPAIWISQGLMQKSDASVSTTHQEGPAIILSGSCSAMTNRQVAAYVEQGHPAFKLDPLELAADGAVNVLNWLSAHPPHEAPLIYATAAPDAVRAAQTALGVERAGALIEDALADCAVRARDLGFRRFVVAGGETAGAVTKALGMSQLTIGREIAPGVPWCFAKTAGHAVAITLKSGNFGNEDFFGTALEVLQA